MKHTPTPWEVAYLDKNGQRVIRAEHIEIATCWHHCVGSIEKEMEANAKLIVRCVNSHDELIDALETILDLSYDDVFVMKDVARAALKKATE